MHLETKSLRRTINKAFLKETVDRLTFNHFKSELRQLLNDINSADRKEHYKNLLTPFFNKTGFKDYYLKTSVEFDLTIHNGKKVKDPVGVLVKAKHPASEDEMITKTDLNRKAAHEAVLYFLEQRIEEENKNLKHIVITDTTNWFVFDAQEIERCFYQTELKKIYKSWKNDQMASANKNLIYSKISHFIDNRNATIQGLRFNLQSYQTFLEAKEGSEHEKKLIPLFKFFSPTHLLKEPFANDSNTLHKEFYKELLYILGLEETTKGNTKFIERASEKIAGRAPSSKTPFKF